MWLAIMSGMKQSTISLIIECIGINLSLHIYRIFMWAMWYKLSPKDLKLPTWTMNRHLFIQFVILISSSILYPLQLIYTKETYFIHIFYIILAIMCMVIGITAVIVRSNI